MREYKLMIPGPVEVSREVRETFNRPTVAHYGEEWAHFYLRTTERLSSMLGCTGQTFILPGSGSVALEASASTFAPERRSLILNNGFFGERLYNIFSRYSDECEKLNFEMGKPIDPDVLNELLRGKRFDIVVFTHVETSTGVLNPVRDIAEIAKSHGALVIVDSISSAAIEKLDMDSWKVDVVVTASQKGLECPPGLGIVSVRSENMREIRNSRKRSWYSDLSVWLDYFEKWHDWHPFPVTLPTNAIMALGKSLDLIEAQGLAEREAQFERTSQKVRSCLKEMGFELFTSWDFSAHGLTAVNTLGKIKPSELVKFLKEKFSVQIAGSLGELSSFLFRIGHMSTEQIKTSNLLTLLVGISDFLRVKGFPCNTQKAISEILEQ